ncbi:MAG: DNA repair protein RecN, partial [Alphaproteobacteria bacterium]|nr:DNA repair protein RecN [Alphaproteobacteria bacterium]
AAFVEAARALSEKRAAAASELDKAVMGELPPLKLDKARFETVLEPLQEDDWGAGGAERVSFRVATNPGSAPGALSKIASGGELSRFSLALKVVLSRDGSVPTLIFDEIDQGIGGATAAAVGERLARLAEHNQVLVVTHSPQVAAQGRAHLRVGKESEGSTTRTNVIPLAGHDRKEEIARMLSGERITEEARAAADQLMRGEAV